MRLQKFMAHCGIASRRKCEEIILKGRVTVNGKVVTDMGIKVDPYNDNVKVDGKRIYLEEDKVYIMLNKPRGYITTVHDPFRRPTVLKLIGDRRKRVYPVGRLDFDTEGLLLLTNDGDLAFHLTHPRHQIEKEYHVIVKGKPCSGDLDRLRKGIDIGGYVTAPAKVEQIDSKGSNSMFKLVIHEGKNRQVRRMFDSIGHPVLYLKRVRIGEIKLGDLKPGQWRYLTTNEVDYLKKSKYRI